MLPSQGLQLKTSGIRVQAAQPPSPGEERGEDNSPLARPSNSWTEDTLLLRNNHAPPQSAQSRFAHGCSPFTSSRKPLRLGHFLNSQSKAKVISPRRAPALTLRQGRAVESEDHSEPSSCVLTSGPGVRDPVCLAGSTFHSGVCISVCKALGSADSLHSGARLGEERPARAPGSPGCSRGASPK